MVAFKLEYRPIGPCRLAVAACMNHSDELQGVPSSVGTQNDMPYSIDLDMLP